jgi:3,4-dihydroxy 2-butanone 4-phosphate synthase/GTP cyclohydrolase II
MARVPEFKEIARKFDFKIISIKHLIEFRFKTDSLIEEIVKVDMPTKWGHFKLLAFREKSTSNEHLALVKGEWQKNEPVLVRVHSSCFTGDILGSLRCDCGDQLHLAMDMISQEGAGVLVYLPQEGRGIGLLDKLKAYGLQDRGMDTVEANLALGFKADSRDYGVGIQLLKDLGLSKVRLLTNNPKKTDAFIYGGFDLEVVDQVPILPPVHEHNARYLATKRDKMGHHLPRGE